MLNNPIIFLTGCIDPQNMSFTILKDIESRKQHYLDSIRYYLKRTDLPILFVENSGNDVSCFFSNEIESNRLEILTFHGNDYERDLGKGYGEMLILEHATLFSHLFKKASYIFKITGRYKVLNINSYIKYYYEKKESFDLLINFSPNLAFVDSRFWGASPCFFTDRLLKYKDIINDSKSVYFEHALSKAIHESIINGSKYSSLCNYPRYSGIYGTLGTSYDDSFLFWFPREILFKILNRIQEYLQIRS